MRQIDSRTIGLPKGALAIDTVEEGADEFADFTDFDDIPRNPVTVEVKPLRYVSRVKGGRRGR